MSSRDPTFYIFMTFYFQLQRGSQRALFIELKLLPLLDHFLRWRARIIKAVQLFMLLWNSKVTSGVQKVSTYRKYGYTRLSRDEMHLGAMQGRNRDDRTFPHNYNHSHYFSTMLVPSDRTFNSQYMITQPYQDSHCIEPTVLPLGWLVHCWLTLSFCVEKISILITWDHFISPGFYRHDSTASEHLSGNICWKNKVLNFHFPFFLISPRISDLSPCLSIFEKSTK